MRGGDFIVNDPSLCRCAGKTGKLIGGSLESFVSQRRRELNQWLEKLSPDPEYLANFRTGIVSGRLRGC